MKKYVNTIYAFMNWKRTSIFVLSHLANPKSRPSWKIGSPHTHTHTLCLFTHTPSSPAEFHSLGLLHREGIYILIGRAARADFEWGYMLSWTAGNAPHSRSLEWTSRQFLVHKDRKWYILAHLCRVYSEICIHIEIIFYQTSSERLQVYATFLHLSSSFQCTLLWAELGSNALCGKRKKPRLPVPECQYLD